MRPSPTSAARLRAAAALGAALAVLAVLGAGAAAWRSHARGSEAGAVAELPAREGEGPVEIEIAGCEAVSSGPVCERVPGSPLRVWAGGAAGIEVAFSTDLGPLSPGERAPLDALSARYVLTPPDGASLLTVHASGGGGRGKTRTLRLAPYAEPAALAEARALRKRGDLSGTEAVLKARAGELDARGKAEASGLSARIALQRGESARAIEGLRGSMREAREAGALSAEAFDAFALAYALVYEGHRLDEAQRALDEARGASDCFPEAAAESLYYAGLVSFESGDMRSALSRLGEAEARSERVGHRAFLPHIRHMLAESLRALGRRDEAHAYFELARASYEPGASPCSQGWLRTNQAWAWLDESLAPATAMPKGPEQAERLAQAREALDQALSLYEQGSCAGSRNVRAALLNRALAAALSGDGEGARRFRARLGGAAGADPVEQAWLDDIDARLALASQRPDEALAAYDRMLRHASLAPSLPARWRATLGRAEALEALGREGDAERAYAAAEALLDELSQSVPLGEGRETFLAERAWGARLRIDQLVRRGRLAEALDAARQSRARALIALRWQARLGALGPDERFRWESAISRARQERAALEALARDGWRVPEAELPAHQARLASLERAVQKATDEALASLGPAPRLDPASLSPRRPDEVLLAMHPVRAGWVLLAETAEGVLARRVAQLSPGAPAEALARELLAPFAPSLRRARRLRVLPFGELRSVDVHALPFDGRPLASSLLVAYGLDLPASPAPAPGAGAARALVLTDPRGDLPQARAEGQAVASSLEQKGLALVRLSGRAATLEQVRAAIGRADLFHFAGHGQFAGRDGFQASLPLADEGRLTVGDVLTLDRCPQVVLLSGCETGRSQALAGESLGLAQAFLVGGSRAVLAATRPIDDPLAALVATQTAGHLGPDLDLASAFDEALRALLASPPPGWEAFRLMVP